MMKMLLKSILLCCLANWTTCQCQKIPFYTAAVVEVNPPETIGDDFSTVAAVTDQMVHIIKSPETKDVDIIVLPEGVFNRIQTAVLLPTSTVFCDDQNAHFLLRNISCAARSANKYVVINAYIDIDCSNDDQKFCSNEIDNTNMYNMAVVFDRNGIVVAQYRKFHLFNELAQVTEKPDLVTFRTDFNVTFGVCICFDLMFYWPPVALIERGVRNFVYPTMWFSELPYLSAVQYQQSWAYRTNVNLLAANINWPSLRCSGSGIYAGRSGALEVFVSQTATTKVLIAKVPVDPQLLSANGNTQSKPAFSGHPISINETSETGIDINPMEADANFSQDDMSVFAIKFLDFSNNLYHDGMVCQDGICCHYDIVINRNRLQTRKPFYSYAISVFSGLRHYKPIFDLGTGQHVCSLIACMKMNDTNSCGKRFATDDIQHHYIIERLTLQTVVPFSQGMKIMPNTLTHNALLPLNPADFAYKVSTLENGKKYAASLSLNTPKSDLLTFAIFSRDYKNDHFPNGGRTTMNSAILQVLCAALLNRSIL